MCRCEHEQETKGALEFGGYLLSIKNILLLNQIVILQGKVKIPKNKIFLSILISDFVYLGLLGGWYRRLIFLKVDISVLSQHK